MAYRCNNLCECKYKAIPHSRGTLKRTDYEAGNRFCSVCSVKYERLDGLICPCCNSHVRSYIRNRIRPRYESVLIVK